MKTLGWVAHYQQEIDKNTVFAIIVVCRFLRGFFVLWALLRQKKAREFSSPYIVRKLGRENCNAKEIVCRGNSVFNYGRQSPSFFCGGWYS